MYYFTDIISARNHRTVGSLDQTLWHWLLEYPSFWVLSDISFLSYVSKSACSSPCNICFRVKKNREVFNSPLDKTNDCFSLIHVDVCEPYKISSSCGDFYFLTIVDDFSRAICFSDSKNLKLKLFWKTSLSTMTSSLTR